MDATEGTQKAAKLLNDLQDINFTEIVIVIVGAWLVTLAANKLFPILAEKVPSKLRLYFLGAVPIIRVLVLVIAISWTIPIVFNITFQNFLIISGAASVAIGFALKDYASSLIAGFVAIFERPYRPGDWVQIQDDYGEVMSVGMRAIRIRTAEDNTISVPHDLIWNNNISNSNDGARTLMCIADFYLLPDHDAEQVRSALRDVALTSSYLEYEKPVHVMLNETPFGTHYRVKAYPFDLRDQFSFISDLTVRGKRAIAAHGGREASAVVSASTD